MAKQPKKGRILKHFKNRLICFLDVLGYSAMVEKEGIEKIYEKYSEFVDVAKSRVFFGTPDDYEGPSNNFEISEIVSDSIVLVSHSVDDVASVNNFIGSINFFLELGLRSGFMFRGCVNQGDIIFDENRRIFLSKEYNDVAKYEPKINAPVCIIFDKAKSTVTSCLFGDSLASGGVKRARSWPIVKWPVPLKGEREGDVDVRKPFWCVNYTFFCKREQISYATQYLEGDAAKRKSFFEYLLFLDELPEEKLVPGAESNNGSYFKVMKSRSGMRVALSNGSGELIEDPIQWGFPKVFVAPPQEVEVQVDPATNRVNFNARGRWS